MCVRVCVCVCARVRQTEEEREGGDKHIRSILVIVIMLSRTCLKYGALFQCIFKFKVVNRAKAVLLFQVQVVVCVCVCVCCCCCFLFFLGGVVLFFSSILLFSRKWLFIYFFLFIIFFFFLFLFCTDICYYMSSVMGKQTLKHM